MPCTAVAGVDLWICRETSTNQPFSFPDRADREERASKRESDSESLEQEKEEEEEEQTAKWTVLVDTKEDAESRRRVPENGICDDWSPTNASGRGCTVWTTRSSRCERWFLMWRWSGSCPRSRPSHWPRTTSWLWPTRSARCGERSFHTSSSSRTWTIPTEVKTPRVYRIQL